ncbi:conserved Plasmodium protein, unknown function [Plasmodium relictum]|uniref:Uncharacterized protein n=1 Tax=Plasmodium relictum TaxID=85471 RepID=A0A1J1H532_PLARL|nr:conserved Plasmodium protein, unknown function [Plasmodium relictum]CRG99866.1 conserved Plasmodium protein, unknown function [Plasmodium relictum]
MNNLNINEKDEENNSAIINKIHSHHEESISTNMRNHVNQINDKTKISSNSSLIKKNKETRFEENFNNNLVFKHNFSIREKNYSGRLINEEKLCNTNLLNNVGFDLKINLVNNNLNDINNFKNNLLNKNDTTDEKPVNTNNNLNMMYGELLDNTKNNNKIQINNDIDIKNIENINDSSFNHDRVFNSNDKNELNYSIQNKMCTTKKIEKLNESYLNENDERFHKNKRSYLEIKSNNTLHDTLNPYDFRKLTNASKENCSTNLNVEYDNTTNKKICLNNNTNISLYGNNSFSKLDDKDNNNFLKYDLQETKKYHINNEKKVGTHEDIEYCQNVHSKRAYNNNILNNNINFEKIEEISDANISNSLNISGAISNKNSKTDVNNNNSYKNTSNNYNNSINDNNNNININNSNNIIVNMNDNCNIDNNSNKETNFKDKYKICNSNILNDKKILDNISINGNDKKLTSMHIEKENPNNNFNDSRKDSLNLDMNGCHYEKKNNYKEIKGNNYSNKNISLDQSKNDSIIQKDGINIILHDNNLSDENYFNENNVIQEKLNRYNISEENQKNNILIRKNENNFDTNYIKKGLIDNFSSNEKGNNDDNQINYEGNREYDIKQKVDKLKEVPNDIYKGELKNNNSSNEYNMRDTNFIKYVNVENDKNISNNEQNRENNFFFSHELNNNFIDNEQKDIKDNNNIFLKHNNIYKLNNLKNRTDTLNSSNDNDVNARSNLKNSEYIDKDIYLHGSTNFNYKENCDKNINKDSNNTIYNFKNEVNCDKFQHKNINNEHNVYEMADINNHTYESTHKNVCGNEVKMRNIENPFDNCKNVNYDKISRDINKNNCNLNCNKLIENEFLSCEKNNGKFYSEFYRNSIEKENYSDYNYLNNIDNPILKTDAYLNKKQEYIDNEKEIKEKLKKDHMKKEEENHDYYYEKTLEFLNEEFYSNNISNLNDRDILEKTPFFKLVNFEKKLAYERKRVLNYHNEDKKQIYSNNINKDKQFSHIFLNNEKFYDAKEILAYLLPYHTFYLDEICLEPYEEDKNISKKLEKDIKKIEEEIYKIKDSFYTFTNPSIVWSFNKIINRITNNFNKKKRIK